MNGTCSARRKKEAQTVENIIGGELQRRDAVDLPDRFRCRVQTIGMVVVAEIIRGEAGGRPCGVTKAQEVNVIKRQGHAIDRRRLRPARARLVDRLQAVEKLTRISFRILPQLLSSYMAAPSNGGGARLIL